MDVIAVNSCLVLAPQVNRTEIITIEALEHDGQLDRMQQSFIDNHAVQCGFCTPDMIMSAKALLLKNPLRHRKKSRSPFPVIFAGAQAIKA